MNRPNILLLTLDTLRADRLGCYGYEAAIAPNIDRLAASGIRFEQAITGGSWTQAAFPVILTSTYASMYGGCLGPLAAERPSPITTLADSGYCTGAFSTSPLLSKALGYDRGFQHFVDLLPGETDPFLRRMKGGQRLLRHSLVHYLFSWLGISTRPGRMYVSAAELTDQLCGWLAGVQAPFFAWAHYMDVHWPYYQEETLKHPRQITQAWQDLGHMHRANWRGATTTPEQYQHYKEMYKEAVRYTDKQIGRLLDYLEQSELLDQTIIILVSDHGEEFMERRRWGHFESNLYDEILKVPFMMAGPGLPAGTVIEDQVRLLDVMPTILDLAGCPMPNGLEGSSLTPLWTADNVRDYDGALSISEMWRDHRHIIAVRTLDFKYIWDSRHPDAPELYDLQSDPEEKHNVCAQFPQQVQQFQTHVDNHLRRLEKEKGQVRQTAVSEMDAELLRRLRGLGYVE
jgi:arylsulfatase A-like enzyme